MQQGHELQGQEATVAVAVIHIRQDGTAELEILTPGVGDEPSTEQKLHFQEEDPPIERYKTLGLLIASLSSGMGEFGEATPPEEVSPDEANQDAQEEGPALQGSATDAPVQSTEDARPEDDPDRSVSPRDDETTQSFISSKFNLAAELRRGLLGEGERPSALRAGALGRLAIRSTMIPIEADLGGGWSRASRPSERLTIDWSFVEVGFATPLTWQALDATLRPRVSVLAERVSARAESASGTATARSARWNFGVGGGAGLSYPGSTPFSVELELFAMSFNGSTGIEVDGKRIGKAPAADGRLALGLSYRFH